MPIPRENPVEWTFWVWAEMFIAGVAAGAYLTAAILELTGRGGSRAARTAHLIAFPLISLGALLLVIDLNRPERFHHMLFQNNRFPLPAFKPWSPISFGTWILGAFAAVTFVSFVDALLAVTRRRLGGWGLSFVHGGPLGVALAVAGGLLAIGVGSYSGLLLQASNFPGWRDTAFLGGEYVATAAITGVAAILFLRPLVPGPELAEDREDVLRLGTYLWTLSVLWLVGSVAFLVLTGPPLRFFFHGLWLWLFLIGSILLALPLIATRRPQYGFPALPAIAALVLVGGLLIRIALVMGPQEL